MYFRTAARELREEEKKFEYEERALSLSAQKAEDKAEQAQLELAKLIRESCLNPRK